MNAKIILALLLVIAGIGYVSGADVSTGWINSAGDGCLEHSAGAKWTVAHDATSSNYKQTYPWARIISSGGTYWTFSRAYVVFNTATIPDDKIVKSAQIKCYYYTKSDSYESNLDVVYFFPANPTSVQMSDYHHYGTARVADSLDIDSVGGTWNYINITDLSVINKTGYTTLGFRVSEDTDNTNPAASGESGVRWYDTTGKIMAINITYGDPDTPEAILTSNKVSGPSPLTVTFTDEGTHFDEEDPLPTYSFLTGDGAGYSGERSGAGEEWVYTYNTPGTYTANLSITQDGTVYYDTVEITVGESAGNLQIIVSGTNTNPISGASVEANWNGELQDTQVTDVNGNAWFDVPYNRMVTGTVNLSGYQNATFSQYVSTWDTWKSVTLYMNNETPGTGDEYWNYIVTFRDASTLETLSNVFIDVYTDSGRTNIFASENAAYGVWTGLLPNDTPYYFTASASNHINLNWTYTMSGSSVSVYKDLLPINYAVLAPVLNIWVYDTSGNPLDMASVSIDSDIDDGYHITNISGYARHFCDNLPIGSSRSYEITVSKGGYTTISQFIDVSTQQPAVYVYLTKTPTATSGVTAEYTPVVTPIWSGDGGTPGNIKEQLINTLMTQFGVGQLEANILMGIILTLLCAVVVGGALAAYGSGSGAGVGAMIGAVVGFSGSSVIGFFPIWILIVVIVLVFAAWFMFRGRDE
jgi:hypothetical protein